MILKTFTVQGAEGLCNRCGSVASDNLIYKYREIVGRKKGAVYSAMLCWRCRDELNGTYSPDEPTFSG